MAYSVRATYHHPNLLKSRPHYQAAPERSFSFLEAHGSFGKAFRPPLWEFSCSQKPATHPSFGQTLYPVARWQNDCFWSPCDSPSRLFLQNERNNVNFLKREIKKLKERNKEGRSQGHYSPGHPRRGEKLPELAAVPPLSWQLPVRASVLSRARLDCERLMLSFCSQFCLERARKREPGSQ